MHSVNSTAVLTILIMLYNTIVVNNINTITYVPNVNTLMAMYMFIIPYTM